MDGSTRIARPGRLLPRQSERSRGPGAGSSSLLLRRQSSHRLETAPLGVIRSGRPRGILPRFARDPAFHWIRGRSRGLPAELHR